MPAVGQNNGCENVIDVPSLNCPGQCLPCAVEAGERVKVTMQ